LIPSSKKRPAASHGAVRAMSDRDIPAVMRIQAECYPEPMLESEAVFRARLALAPATCWIWSGPGQGAGAYLFSYPSSKDAVTALDHPFTIPAAPDCLYLHDLAVAPDARGRRAANALATAALEKARADGLGWSALVSVQRSQVFWETLGYAAVESPPSPARENLASYQVQGNQGAAVYMRQQLT
jgi:GNAT superfamily N-acetyltransferase